MRLLAREMRASALAYNLGNFVRTLATPEPLEDWLFTSLKEKLLRLIAELRPPPVTSAHEAFGVTRIVEAAGDVCLD